MAEIERDMALDVPMMRLVQGDVGSGKTLVAALAALRAVAHGKQVALMAPTELLAEQHANNFRNWFAPLGIEVGWLAGKQKGKARLAQQEAIASGQVQMIVGTHAIFQEQVQFNGLALVIIDEQHRFGVHQRLALWEKGQQQGFHSILGCSKAPWGLSVQSRVTIHRRCKNPMFTVANELSYGGFMINKISSSSCFRNGAYVFLDPR